MVTRGSVDCTGNPAWFVAGDAEDFFKDQLHLTMWDLLTMFEAWSVSWEKSKWSACSLTTTNTFLGLVGVERSSDIRKDCTRLMTANLSE